MYGPPVAYQDFRENRATESRLQFIILAGTDLPVWLWHFLYIFILAHLFRQQEGHPQHKEEKRQRSFNQGLNYTNPIIVINCWENSALIAPKQHVQLYTALMWI